MNPQDRELLNSEAKRLSNVRVGIPETLTSLENIYNKGLIAGMDRAIELFKSAGE